MNSTPVIKAIWTDDQKQGHEVTILHFYEDDTALIVQPKRSFSRLPLSELRFSRIYD